MMDAALANHTPQTDKEKELSDYNRGFELLKDAETELTKLRADNKALLQALKGLLHRREDGSEEKYWAEWDTAKEALAATNDPAALSKPAEAENPDPKKEKI